MHQFKKSESVPKVSSTHHEPSQSTSSGAPYISPSKIDFEEKFVADEKVAVGPHSKAEKPEFEGKQNGKNRNGNRSKKTASVTLAPDIPHSVSSNQPDHHSESKKRQRPQTQANPGAGSTKKKRKRGAAGQNTRQGKRERQTVNSQQDEIQRQAGTIDALRERLADKPKERKYRAHVSALDIIGKALFNSEAGWNMIEGTGSYYNHWARSDYFAQFLSEEAAADHLWVSAVPNRRDGTLTNSYWLGPTFYLPPEGEFLQRFYGVAPDTDDFAHRIEYRLGYWDQRMVLVDVHRLNHYEPVIIHDDITLYLYNPPQEDIARAWLTHSQVRYQHVYLEKSDSDLWSNLLVNPEVLYGVIDTWAVRATQHKLNHYTVEGMRQIIYNHNSMFLWSGSRMCPPQLIIGMVKNSQDDTHIAHVSAITSGKFWRTAPLNFMQSLPTRLVNLGLTAYGLVTNTTKTVVDIAQDVVADLSPDSPPPEPRDPDDPADDDPLEPGDEDGPLDLLSGPDHMEIDNPHENGDQAYEATTVKQSMAEIVHDTIKNVSKGWTFGLPHPFSFLPHEPLANSEHEVPNWIAARYHECVSKPHSQMEGYWECQAEQCARGDSKALVPDGPGTQAWYFERSTDVLMKDAQGEAKTVSIFDIRNQHFYNCPRPGLKFREDYLIESEYLSTTVFIGLWDWVSIPLYAPAVCKAMNLASAVLRLGPTPEHSPMSPELAWYHLSSHPDGTWVQLRRGEHRAIREGEVFTHYSPKSLMRALHASVQPMNGILVPELLTEEDIEEGRSISFAEQTRYIMNQGLDNTTIPILGQLIKDMSSSSKAKRKAGLQEAEQTGELGSQSTCFTKTDEILTSAKPRLIHNVPTDTFLEMRVGLMNFQKLLSKLQFTLFEWQWNQVYFTYGGSMTPTEKGVWRTEVDNYLKMRPPGNHIQRVSFVLVGGDDITIVVFVCRDGAVIGQYEIEIDVSRCDQSQNANTAALFCCMFQSICGYRDDKLFAEIKANMRQNTDLYLSQLLMLCTGVGETGIFNSCTVGGVAVMGCLFGFHMDLKRFYSSWGFSIKISKVPYLMSTFHKGFWIKVNEKCHWLPLPSRIVKFGWKEVPKKESIDLHALMQHLSEVARGWKSMDLDPVFGALVKKFPDSCDPSPPHIGSAHAWSDRWNWSRIGTIFEVHHCLKFYKNRYQLEESDIITTIELINNTPYEVRMMSDYGVETFYERDYCYDEQSAFDARFVENVSNPPYPKCVMTVDSDDEDIPKTDDSN